MRKITIDQNDHKQTLIKFLNKYLSKAPNSLLYKWIRKKKIKVNKKKAEPSYTLEEGDIIDLYIYDEELDKWQEDKNNFKSKVSVDIAFENEDVIIMDKPQNLLVHAASPEDYGKNLVDFMVDLLISRGEYNPRLDTTFRPSLVNRIDRNTMGLVIGAKNRDSLLTLNEEQDKINKYYLAIVDGEISKKIQIHNELKKTDDNTVYIDKGGKKSTTLVRPIKSNKNFSLVEIELVTGRTHQIRASLAHIGYPILGDRRYGNNQGSNKFKDQQLVAYKLEFDDDISIDSLKSKVIYSKYKNKIEKLYDKLIGG